jgi:hypothetical protein
MSTFTHGSIAEDSERKALQAEIERLRDLLGEANALARIRYERLAENLDKMERLQIREAKMRGLIKECFERPLLACGPLLEQMMEELK